MITGYNTDIRHKGVTFHVQTEDKGRSNPKVESLVYQGGAILDRRRTSYADVLGVEDLQTVVMKLMEEQHQAIIADIKAGRYDADRGDAFAQDLLSNKSLDEIILEHLGFDDDALGVG